MCRLGELSVVAMERGNERLRVFVSNVFVRIGMQKHRY